MSVMFEVNYGRPQNVARETQLTGQVVALSGRFGFWEESEIPGVCNNICLTYEFNEWAGAEHAAKILREQGEYLEGPQEYGD